MQRSPVKSVNLVQHPPMLSLNYAQHPAASANAFTQLYAASCSIHQCFHSTLCSIRQYFHPTLRIVRQCFRSTLGNISLFCCIVSACLHARRLLLVIFSLAIAAQTVGMIVKTDVARPTPPSSWQDLVPEHEKDVLKGALALKGDALVTRPPGAGRGCSGDQVGCAWCV
eukprot:1156183-Pelagomonas_calceolata.AAC.8